MWLFTFIIYGLYRCIQMFPPKNAQFLIAKPLACQIFLPDVSTSCCYIATTSRDTLICGLDSWQSTTTFSNIKVYCFQSAHKNSQIQQFVLCILSRYFPVTCFWQYFPSLDTTTYNLF